MMPPQSNAADYPRRRLPTPGSAWPNTAIATIRETSPVAGSARTIQAVLLAAAVALIAQSGYASEEAGRRVLKFSVARGGDALLLPVRLDRRHYLFMFDTGCTESVFDESFGDKLGEPLRTCRVRTTVGEISASIFRCPAATIGGRPLTGVVEVGRADLSLMRSVSGHEIYGVLGMDFLQSQQVRIDFDRGELAFLDSVPEDAGTRIPLYFSPEHGPIVAEVDIGGTRELFAIDTGCVGVGNLETSLLERLVRTGHANSFRSVEVVSAGSKEAVSQPRARVAAVDLQGLQHRGLVFAGGRQNALGSLYLARYIVTFDFPSMIMYLKPGRLYDEPSRHDLSGLGVWRPTGQTTVDCVDDGSAGQRAGIRAGDVIDTIDDRAASSMSVFQIRSLFAAPGTHALRLKRGKESLAVVLVLKESQRQKRRPIVARRKKGE